MFQIVREAPLKANCLCDNCDCDATSKELCDDCTKRSIS